MNPTQTHTRVTLRDTYVHQLVSIFLFFVLGLEGTVWPRMSAHAERSANAGTYRISQSLHKPLMLAATAAGIDIKVTPQLQKWYHASQSRLPLHTHYARNVFALCELEDVLLAVDDLEVALGRPHANVAAVQPAFSVDGLGGLGRVLVVAREHVGAGIDIVKLIQWP